MRTVSRLVRLAAIALVGAAVAQELRKPSSARTWHGQVAGAIPYDFRRPTFDHVRRAWWNPADDRLLTPQVFGVGWSINLGRIARTLGLTGPG